LTHSKLPNLPAPNLSFNGGYVEAGWVCYRRREAAFEPQ
jgi:hypothetical protein